MYKGPMDKAKVGVELSVIGVGWERMVGGEMGTIVVEQHNKINLKI